MGMLLVSATWAASQTTFGGGRSVTNYSGGGVANLLRGLEGALLITDGGGAATCI